MVRRAALLLAGIAALGQPLAAQVPVPLAAAPPPAAPITTAPPSAAPPPAAPPSALPRPAIWLVEDSDTRIYLFGTVHLFPAALRWRSAALDRVIGEADELVMETPDASVPTPASSARMLQAMSMGKSVPLLQRVSPAAREPLAALIAATPIPADALDQMHTWAAGFVLAGLAARGGAGARMSGAEEVLGILFRKSRRPVSGVETADGQIRVLSSMPLAAQRRFLESLVTGPDAYATPGATPGAGFDPTTERSWVTGNVEAIAAEMRTMPPELYERLLTIRNRAWTQWLAERLERPGTVLFAVGAGHLAGADSVQAMLATRGITARRVD